MTNKELDLIKASKSGDIHSFSLLFEDLRPQLYAKALYFSGHGADAKDAVQDTYIKALSNIRQLQTPGKFKSWIFTILRNECFLQKRTEKQKLAFRNSVIDHRQAHYTLQTIEEKFEKADIDLTIRRYISALSVEKRLTILLRYFSAYNSYKEIAHIMDVPVGTVRSRLSKAREELQQMPQDQPPALSIDNGKKELFRAAWEHLYSGKRKRFLSIFDNDLNIRYTSGKRDRGLQAWAEEWDIDLQTGVRFKPNLVATAKNISVVEGPIINPPDKPDTCPPGGSFVLFHRNDMVKKVHIHYAPR